MSEAKNACCSASGCSGKSFESYTVKTMYDYFQLVGKVVIVTGAGMGIGRSTAEKFAALGAKVVGCDIAEAELQSLAEEIAAFGGEFVPLYCDITNKDDIKKVVAVTLERFGTIDVLVNNAAGFGGGVTIDDMTDEEWLRLIDLNLNSVYYFTMAVLPTMRKNQSGRIVNLSSGAAIQGEPTDPHYAAAKGGVLSLTKEMAREVAKDKVHVNVVAPGPIKTRMGRDEEINDIVWYKLGEPEDVANSIIFISSAASDYYTGQTLTPNGGNWM